MDRLSNYDDAQLIIWILIIIIVVLIIINMVYNNYKVSRLQTDLDKARDEVIQLSEKVNRDQKKAAPQNGGCLVDAGKFLLTYIVPILLFPHEPRMSFILFLICKFGDYCFEV